MHRYDHRPVCRTVTADLGLDTRTRRLAIQGRGQARALFDKLDDWMRVLGYPHKDLFAVRLIVFEALTNAIRHGHGNDPSKQVQVRYLVTPTEVLVDIRDQGPGFNAAHLEDPLSADNSRVQGRGIFLMRAYSSWLSFNRQGNQVTLCRHRTD